MYNYQLLTKSNKTEILEKLAKWSLSTFDWNKYEEVADHIIWLFEEMDKEVEKTFFPEKRKEKTDVQLPENNE